MLKSVKATLDRDDDKEDFIEPVEQYYTKGKCSIVLLIIIFFTWNYLFLSFFLEYKRMSIGTSTSTAKSHQEKGKFISVRTFQL